PSRRKEPRNTPNARGRRPPRGQADPTPVRADRDRATEARRVAITHQGGNRCASRSHSPQTPTLNTMEPSLESVSAGRPGLSDRIIAEVHRRMLCQDYLIERLLSGLLTGGLVLFEGLP